MIQPQRIRPLNREGVRRRRYVLYWMQVSQRAASNHALEYAAERANELGRPVVAAFGLTDRYPDANARHYTFLLEGLAETARDLAARGVQLVVRRGEPAEVAAELSGDAALVVTDRGYLRHQRTWRRQLARAVDCRAVQVESDVVVPVQTASNKAEYAARTIRPKLRRRWEAFLRPVRRVPCERDSLDLDLGGMDLSNPAGLVEDLVPERQIDPSTVYRGGAAAARQWLAEFLDGKLARYAEARSDPGANVQSELSPYLHFGQISPIEIALAARRARAPQAAKDAFLEELLVRRELGINFAFYQSRYDSYAALPAWARATLKAHTGDKRPALYRRNDLEQARTHDDYWNAAMTEMRVTGKMHNYMRMYWGKKIIEWTRSPRTAYRWMRDLDETWFLDGRDPVSYANVGWCFGLHDRPWGERDVFGTVRTMSSRGLERKFDMSGYLRRVAALEAGAQA